MNRKMNEKYSNVIFSDELIDMYLEIIEQSEINLKVLIEIYESYKDDIPITISQLGENIVVTRRVGKRLSNGKRTFELKEAPMERKSVEKVIDRFLHMGLVYLSNEMYPYKKVFITTRGIQVSIGLFNKLSNQT